MSDRAQLLTKINEISFLVNDLTLYLDTHPTDAPALDAFSQAMAQRKQLLEEYARQYEPLTEHCICPDTNNQSSFYTKYPNTRHSRR